VTIDLLDDAAPVLWNPVKELKVTNFQTMLLITFHEVESGEGIERSLTLRVRIESLFVCGIR